MKTDYTVVNMIRQHLDYPGKYGFMRAANALLDGSFDKGAMWRYMRDVFGLPRHLFGEFLHHFRIAVETEIAWRRREKIPHVVSAYMNGGDVPGMDVDKRDSVSLA